MLTLKCVFISNFVPLLKFGASKLSWISHSNNLKWESDIKQNDLGPFSFHGIAAGRRFIG